MQELTFEQVEVVSGGVCTSLASCIKDLATSYGLAELATDAMYALWDASEELRDDYFDKLQEWGDNWQDANCPDMDIYECAEHIRGQDSSGLM